MGVEVEAVRRALAQGGCAEVDPLIPSLIGTFARPAEHDNEVRQVLLTLRSHRCFSAMDDLASGLSPHTAGSLGIFIRRQLAQAKVDRGRLDTAIDVLTKLLTEVEESGSKKDCSEVTGLLGRVYKQQFVNATKAGGNGAVELRKAIASHHSVFELDPSWHGANLVALSARAERAGIHIDTGTAKTWAERLLKDLSDRGRASWGPWDFAAAGEAYLALPDEERSAECFRVFWSMPNVDAFALGGAARQLREIWQAGAHPDSLPSSILAQLEARTLGRAGGFVEWLPGDVRERAAGIYEDLRVERAEALFGADSTLQLKRLLQLIRHARSICRIADTKTGKAVGTGFLVDGALFGPPSQGALLLTNHHVLHGPEAKDELLASPDYQGSIALDRAEAKFTYWDDSSERRFEIKNILRTSDRPDADFTLASLAADEVPQGLALPISIANKPLRSRNILDPKQRSKVLLIGHPRGEELTFSLDNTEVVDHELDDELRTRPRRIHYRATTDHGSSGSPVFEFESLEVVGLHRSGRVGPLREDWPHKPGDVYQANEAVWIGSIRSKS